MASIRGFHGVRYQSRDVERSLAFYTQELGFKLDHQALPAFAQVSMGPLKLFLSGPGASGSRPLPNNRRQEPGGRIESSSTGGRSGREADSAGGSRRQPRGAV